MWFYEPVAETIPKSKSDFALTAAIIAVIGIFAFGIYPELVFRYLRTIF
jgi:hypothetical protein